MGKALPGEVSCVGTGLVIKGNHFCKFLFASLENIEISKWVQLLKERIAPTGVILSLKSKMGSIFKGKNCS